MNKNLSMIFFEKYKDDDAINFPLTKFFNAYLNYYNKNYTILISPGYLSCSEKKIKSFCQKFPFNKNNIYFKTGMNGNKFIKGKRIIKFYKEEIIRINKNKVEVFNDLTNHSKTMLFFDIENSEKLTINNIEEYLKEDNLRAILIGSSNFSYQTYYGNETLKADKGETDVFIELDRANRPNLEYFYNNLFGRIGVENVAFFKSKYNNLNFKKIINNFLGHEDTLPDLVK